MSMASILAVKYEKQTTSRDTPHHTHQKPQKNSQKTHPHTGPTSAPPSHHTGPTSAPPPPRGRLRPLCRTTKDAQNCASARLHGADFGPIPAHATHRDTPAKSFSGTPLVLARVDGVAPPAALCPFLYSVNTQFGARSSQNGGAWSGAEESSSVRSTELLSHACRTPLPAAIYFKRL